MTSAIDATKPITGTPTTQSVRDQFATARDEITALQAAVAAQGVPTGGTAGQVLSKIDATNYNTQWSTPTTGGGSGTVTSVAAGTGLTASPSPITGAGTMSLTTPVSIANGGTNAVTASAGLTNLGGYPTTGGIITGPVTITGNASALPASPAAYDVRLWLASATNALPTLLGDAFGTGVNAILWRQAGGTALSPAVTPANGILGTIQSIGHTGAAYATAAAVGYNQMVRGTWAAGSQPTKHQFNTTASGSTSLVVAAEIGDGMLLGSATDPGYGNLALGSAPAQSSVLKWTVGGSGHTWLAYSDGPTSTWVLMDNAAARITVDGTGACKNVTGTWAAFSDLGLKAGDTIADYTTGLASLIQLRPVTFGWARADYGPEQNWGLIAQEVEPVMPELVGEAPVLSTDANSGEPVMAKTVDYGRIIFSVINALKEVSQRLDAIEARLG